MLKILHARLQHYVNQELSDVRAGLRKGRAARDQTANICWIIQKAREFQENIYLCFIDYAKVFDLVDHNKLWKALKKKRITGYLNCLLRNQYESQGATVRTLYGTTNWFKSEKGVQQGCLLSYSLFKLYVEHIMRNTRVGELQARIWIGGRNIQQPQIDG